MNENTKEQGKAELADTAKTAVENAVKHSAENKKKKIKKRSEERSERSYASHCSG